MSNWQRIDTDLDVPVKSLFSKRYLRFLQAGLDSATLVSVLYNVIEYQRKHRTVRTDRPEPAKIGGKDAKESRTAYIERMIPVMRNTSDAKVLTQLAAFRESHSLDMGDEADAWFAYVTEGGEMPVVC